MKRIFLAAEIALGTALLISSLTTTVYASKLENKYFSNSNPTLTQQERQALAIAKKWQAGSGHGNVKPFAGRDGSIQFVYGVQQVSVVCAVLQVCDIALQNGESVNSIQLGDTARWNVEPAISGTGISETQHLLIKPMDVGLETSLVVATDRRVYHIRLRSHRTKYMPQVSFIYPSVQLAKWQTIHSNEQKVRENNTIPQTHEYLGNLSFKYTISGDASWKPIRVYNDGRKTIIQMSSAMKQTEAPTLLVIRPNSKQKVMVNYRVQGDRYIVDTIFKKAILISGIGSNQTKVTINKE